MIENVGGSTCKRASIVTRALTSPEFFSLFVRGQKWSPDAFGDWLHTVAEEQLLAGPSARTPGEAATTAQKGVIDLRRRASKSSPSRNGENRGLRTRGPVRTASQASAK